MDSYELFLKHFNISKKAFYEWGIQETVFPEKEAVAKEWDALKQRIFGNEEVCIRGYGRDAHGTQLYIDLYAFWLGNTKIKKDPTNNNRPQRIIERLTSLRRNDNIFNYQVSHIWGHTKNVFLFEAPWNICLVPKIMDPFTGHETKGAWPMEYQEIFIEAARERYDEFIEDYNKLISRYDIAGRLEEFLVMEEKKGYERNMLLQFKKDVLQELRVI